jgi:hypothetical protein
MTQDELIVYWAPDFLHDQPMDWNYVYNDPKNVILSLKEKVQDPGVLLCPSVKDVLKNTFYLSSTLGVDCKYDSTSNTFVKRNEFSLGIDQLRDPSFRSSLNVTIGLSWIFFCEEPILMEVTPPYFSQATHLQYGSIVPGSFDIGSWFRPINAEFILNFDVKDLKVIENEPIAYVKFKTDKKIKFKRFYMNEDLKKIERSCANSRDIFGKLMPLSSRYNLFRSTKTNKKVLHHINKNLLEKDIDEK